jgi:DNA repair protein RecN (Recombination protein N)
MLAQLSIRNIVLIESLDISFMSGLTVLTGETGAGKSILLDSLNLALGGRGDAGLVRSGQPQGQITAVFDIAHDHTARIVARAHDLSDEGDLILRRIQFTDGRTRAFINDQPVSVQAMRNIGRALVEIHGQHDDRALVDPSAHRLLLDAYGGLTRNAEHVAQLWRSLRQAIKARDVHQAHIERVRAEADYLRHAHDELEKLAPEAGEEGRLAEQRQRMIQAENVTSDLREAHETLSGGHAIVPTLSSVMRRLDRRIAQAPHLIEPAVSAIDAALISLDEAATLLEQALRDAEFDPREQERVEERLFALRAAARKYDTAVENLPDVAEKFTQQLEALDAGEDQLSVLGKAVEEAQTAYSTAACALSRARQQAASELETAVMAELPDLKLERARFITNVGVDAEQPSADGIDHVEFWVQTNPGTRAGPMLKVASGGELARFLLALKVALAERISVSTLIFDEIDTGVGGAVADAIGTRLARLGTQAQVLAVTHAPQVAARADQHMLIAKGAVVDEDRMATEVTPLDTAPRREEIARMLAGAAVTDEARAAAQRLLQGAA